MHQNRVQLRLLIIAGFVTLWMGAVFARLGFLQLIEHGDYLARAHRQQQRTIEITPKRGAIYDRNMRPLAMSTEVESAFAIPTELGENKALAAHLLSGVLNVPNDVLEKKFNMSPNASCRPESRERTLSPARSSSRIRIPAKFLRSRTGRSSIPIRRVK